MIHTHKKTHTEQQQLTGNLIKPALMKSLLPNRGGEERRDERKGGEKEDKVIGIDDAH